MLKQDNQYVALTKCFFCGEDNQIIMHRRFGDLSEIHGKIINMEPCSTCQEHMKKGVILLVIDEKKSPDKWWEKQLPNPYRTGLMAVIKDEAIQRLFNPETADRIINKTRWSFISSEAANQIGLKG